MIQGPSKTDLGQLSAISVLPTLSLLTEDPSVSHSDRLLREPLLRRNSEQLAIPAVPERYLFRATKPALPVAQGNDVSPMLASNATPALCLLDKPTVGHALPRQAYLTPLNNL